MEKEAIYENRWGIFSKKAMKALRCDVPTETPGLMKDGWARPRTLRERGIKIKEERAEGLSKGKGGGGVPRFGMAEIQDTMETVIRPVQKENRRRGGKGKRYTPTR